VHEIQSSSAYTVREYVSCCPQRLNLVDNNPFYECAPFVSGYLWGPVVQADLLTLPDGTSEQAFNIQIQVVGPPRQASTPSTCRNSGRGFGHAPGIGADGILGIGVFSNDCGIWCQGYRGWRLHLLFLPLGRLHRCLRRRGAARTKNTYLLHGSIAWQPARRASKRAIVAIGHKILVLAHSLLRHSCPFRERGADYYQRLRTPSLSQSLVRRLQRLGFEVALAPAQLGI